MARFNFGGALTDFAITSPSARANAVFAQPNATGSVYAARTGGSALTDLLDSSGNPTTTVSTDANGFINRFQGPDGYTDLWVDLGGGSRFLIRSIDGKVGFDGRGRDRLQAVNASELKVWRAALANRDVAPAKILCIGDSVTEGQGATTLTAPWPARLKQALFGMYPMTGVGARPNYRPAKTNQTTFTTEWTVGGSPTNPTDYGLAHTGQQISGTQTLTLTVFGTSVGVTYLKGALGSWSYAVDGGTATTVSSASGTVVDGNVQTITFDSRGWHSVVIAVVSGTNVITGAFIYDGDEAKGIQVVNAGHSGNRTDQWAGGTGYSTARLTENIAAYGPHLVTIAFGHNDYNAANGITPTAFGSNLQTIVNVVNAAVSVAPSIVLIGYAKRGDYTNPTYTWQQYLDQMQAVADANGNVTFLDMSLRMVDGTDTALGLYADSLHPSNKGHAYVGDSVAAYITQDVARGTAPAALIKGQASPAPTRPGLYYQGLLQSVSTAAFGLNNLKVQPFAIGRDGTIDRIAAEVTTAAAGALVRMFVYDDADGAPGNLLLDAGTIDGSTTGVKELTVSLSVTTGIYWVGAVSVGTADCTLRSSIGSNTLVGWPSLPGAGATSSGYQGTLSGSLPTRWPALAVASSVPRQLIRVS